MPAKPVSEHLAQAIIKVNGEILPPEIMHNLLTIELDDSLHLPDMFSIHWNDPDVQMLQADRFKPGDEIDVTIQIKDGKETTFNGEITAVEPDLNATARTTVMIRGYDRSHRMNRVRLSRSYQQVTDADVARRLAQGAGLKADVDSTREVYPYLLQTNQTDWEFLESRARRVGYRLWVEKRTLHFKKPPPNAPITRLEWGITLSEFRARMSTVEQVNEVVVRGYDPKAKREIVGRAAKSKSQPEIGIGGRHDGGEAAQTAHGIQGRHVVVDRPVYTQAEADMLARSTLDDINSSFLQADGVCGGQPTVTAGSYVELSGLGSHFGGRYMVTRALHRYSQKGYTTHFWISGGQGTATITDLLKNGNGARGAGASSPTALGVVVGIVTNNVDPDNMGRVKVKFPWLGDNQESWWCRLASPMAGASRGIVYFPEVNDEVVCAFELGDPNRGYVLGAVWNGSDKLPKPTSWFTTGSVIRRATFSRVGHNIVIVDEPPTSGIVLSDRTGNQQIKINSDTHETSNTIEMSAQEDVTITVRGKIVLEAQGDIELDALGKVTISGKQGVDINGAPGVTSIKGSQVQLN